LPQKVASRAAVPRGFWWDAPILKAELNFTTDTGKWQDRRWQTIPAAWEATAGTASCTLPKNSPVHYFNLVDTRDLVVSGEHELTGP
jgi:hypothetical protein